ncbi:uncharacterized protein LY89DRAFT_699675 [Mollisia scopiformis]|uniref:F-box domain-containing protein n=1 Tax=Mollisia scopiformis TaxID=149040 RepID=A0A194WWM0_MOLSC|nr:uncharacterized protein LY89DRAFT_699675 [Mollisia scopiformis]KUJ12345.1 hypothetical protein LY89DRAFT_699675 [Mollisia scopiformis]
MASPLRLRLLQDIAEMQTNHYPGIALYIQDDDISTGCLILTVKGYGPMHLTINFNSDYPLTPPVIRMDSKMDYTPAYTLKGIAIQLLSFFSNDKIQQVSDFFFTLEDFRNLHVEQNAGMPPYECVKCDFSTHIETSISDSVQDLQNQTKSNQIIDTSSRPPCIQAAKLPDEMLLSVFEYLESENLLAFAEAWPKIADVIVKYNVIRTRELHCFCLKQDYMTSKLGVGISLTKEEKGNKALLGSEFDLLSEDAFELGIRRSVQGLPFRFWLPLPLSESHWERVRDDVDPALAIIADRAGYGDVENVYVLFKLLNDVIVRLSKETEETTYRSPIYPYEEKAKSTLKHASEKAIESYYHIFHLLLCKATGDPWIVDYANTIIDSFEKGATSRDYIQNLGHFLIATLISDREVSKKMIQNIITEAATRNVNRVLQKHPELAYLEPTTVSKYRLQKSFEASKTSYRILMFLNIFRRTALRDSAFARHGAPPPGGAKELAEDIKRIHAIDNFGHFLLVMGMPMMPKEWVCQFLRDRMKDAIRLGYCGMSLTQGQAMTLRREKEPNIAVAPGIFFLNPPKPEKDGGYNFRAKHGGKGRGRK